MRWSRTFDYMVVVVAAFLVISVTQIHFILLAGDWDFFIDWKDRQYWVLITPIVTIMMAAAFQAVFWNLFRLPIGATASIGLLRGPAGTFALPACAQRIKDDGRFEYLGGIAPIATDLAARARRLALASAAVMPTWTGYIGLDLVLGAADDGSEDFVIEVNPRLTTSYV
ncbi:MAG: methane monooxygenase/ammonia monooxygenase subunit A, partial [Betaproteobacteria bacterium]